MGKRSTPADKAAARRMQSASDKNPDSKTAKTGAAPRVQSAADKNATRDQGGKRSK